MLGGKKVERKKIYRKFQNQVLQKREIMIIAIVVGGAFIAILNQTVLVAGAAETDGNVPN